MTKVKIVKRDAAVEAAPTEQLLRLYERYFSPLDPKGRARIAALIETRASADGWRGMDGLAA